MREGVFHPLQHDPTVMSMSVNELLNGCNRKNCILLQRSFNQLYEKLIFRPILAILNVRGDMAPKQKLKAEKERLETESAKSCDLIEVPVPSDYPFGPLLCRKEHGHIFKELFPSTSKLNHLDGDPHEK